MTTPIIDPAPLHVADLTVDQALRFAAACQVYLGTGQIDLIDVDGYLMFDDVIAYVLGDDDALTPHLR